MVPSGWVPLGSRLSKRCNGASSHARHAGSRIGDFASPSKSDSPTPRDKRANAEMQAHSTTTTLHASRPCTVARALASRSGRLRSDARPAMRSLVLLLRHCLQHAFSSAGLAGRCARCAAERHDPLSPGFHTAFSDERAASALWRVRARRTRGRGGLSEPDSDGMRWRQVGSGSLGARATANATRQRCERRGGGARRARPKASGKKSMRMV